MRSDNRRRVKRWRTTNKRGFTGTRVSRLGKALPSITPKTSGGEKERRALVRALRDLDLSVYPVEYRTLFRAYLEPLLAR